MASRDPKEILKAHDWKLGQDGLWHCHKCGTQVLSRQRPNRYARAEVGPKGPYLVKKGGSLLCHELTVWKVMET